MSKRNFILLIIILVLVVIAIFGFLYFQARTIVPGEPSTGTNFISQFNPFASNKTTTPPAVTPSTDIPNNEPGVVQPAPDVKLHKVSSIPIAGFTVFSKERLKDVPVPQIPPATPAIPAKKSTVKPTAPATEFMPALRYVERATGNIYQTFVDKIIERRFSTTVIPKIYEASFGNSGNSVIMRHLKGDDRTIETFVGVLPKEKISEDSDTNEIKGAFLVDSITDMSVSPDSSKLFYLLNVGDNIIGTILNLANSKKTQIFNSAFTEWNSFWPNNKIITLTTKPSGSVPGYMYAINPDNKSLTKVFGGINGLTTLMSPNGKLVLYGDNNLSLYLYHTDTKTSELLGVKTLPEKCVWNKTSEFVYCAVPGSIVGATYPDDWYQGVVSFSDQIWKISIAGGNSNIIADPVTITGGEDIDGIKLALDTDENYLFFVNKKDSFLWELQLN